MDTGKRVADVSDRLGDLVRELHGLPECGFGGPLHIITDDSNVRDSDLKFCRDEILGKELHWSLVDQSDEMRQKITAICLEILDILSHLTRRQRREAMDSW